MANSTSRLAQEIASLRSRVDQVARSPQLGNSSIENANLKVKNAAGATTLIIGQQFDGTAVAASVNGPTPPQPVMPTLTAFPGGTRVNWSGEFEDPQPGFTSPVVAPMDFARVDVHVSSSAVFTPTDATRSGEITSPAGGFVFVNTTAVDPSITRYYRLVAVSLSGKSSVPSGVASVVLPGAATVSQINAVEGDIAALDTDLQSQINSLASRLSRAEAEIDTLQSQMSGKAGSVHRHLADQIDTRGVEGIYGWGRGNVQGDLTYLWDNRANHGHAHTHRSDQIVSNGAAGQNNWTANVQGDLQYIWANRNLP